MSNEYKDVIRHEDTTANLPSTTRNGQTTYETDLQRRQLHPTTDGIKNHWTPDEKFTADIPSYTNIGVPAITTVKEMLDFLLSAVSSAGGVVYSTINLPAVSGVGIFWFNPDTGWLMFRKKLEDSDPFVYPVNLADPQPE